MEQGADIFRELGQFFDGEDHAGLVIGPLNADQSRLIRQSGAIGVEIELSRRIDAMK